MQIVELPSHPFFIGAQFHPEFKSRPGKPSPLFLGIFPELLPVYFSSILPWLLLISILFSAEPYIEFIAID